jgi:hypothetical protein
MELNYDQSSAHPFRFDATENDQASDGELFDAATANCALEALRSGDVGHGRAWLAVNSRELPTSLSPRAAETLLNSFGTIAEQTDGELARIIEDVAPGHDLIASQTAIDRVDLGEHARAEHASLVQVFTHFTGYYHPEVLERPGLPPEQSGDFFS